jgi:alanine dehydrogenase
VTLVLDEAAVGELIGMPLAIDAMHHAFELEARGLVTGVSRMDTSTGAGWLRVLCAVIDGDGVFGFKAMNLATNTGVRYQIHVYSIVSGDLLAIVDAKSVTAARTAGCSAVATKLLARTDVSDVAIVGTGWEARAQFRAMHTLYPKATFHVHSRSSDHRRAFSREMATETGARIELHDELETAVERADVIVVATKSGEPVLDIGHAVPGVHINSIGATRPDQHEIAPALFGRCERVVFDDVPLVLREAGDAARAVACGALRPETPTALAELVAGRQPARSNRSQVTLYKSVGTAAQDLVLAYRVFELAVKRGLGVRLDGFPSLKPV